MAVWPSNVRRGEDAILQDPGTAADDSEERACSVEARAEGKSKTKLNLSL